ncbi:hypothetical protein Ocin01_00720 [Orchesella cincta]|uniref:Ubiquitin-like domain-containing protein n=1 Tax=Orchesella cincta TaxID=48709 RepID=A0A1D2NL72_ORCCI|nr:hypothetical protein Ocin01_00720 [Orchesella cincta]
MLQLDPARRGKKLSAPEEAESRSPSPCMPVVGLQMLSNILSTKVLHVRTISKRLGFAIGKSTKMSDIQQLIARDTGLATDNQLILTNDGVEVTKDDLALKFVELTDLYLIPRSPELIRQRLKMPKSVNSFLTSWQTIKDPNVLRVTWASAVYFVKAELGKIETLKRASAALKAWINSKYVVELRNLQSSIDKAGACLEKILELEGQLVDLEKKAKKHQEDPAGSGIAFWKSEMETLRAYYCGCLDDWCETVVLKPVSESQLEEIYYTILRHYDEGKSSDGSIGGAHSEALVTNVCQFVVQRDQTAESITHNVTAQLDKVRNDHKLVENLRSVVDKLNAITAEVMESRYKTHSRMLGLLGDQSNGLDQRRPSSSKRQLNAVGQTNPNSVAGGGCPEKDSKVMSKSASVSSSPMAKSTQAKGLLMARSLNSPLNRLCPSPPIAKLMEESLIIKSEAEGTLKSLNDSLGRMSSILQESSELDWEFLDA